jgi:type VI secretion system secreted protein VgrG
VPLDKDRAASYLDNHARAVSQGRCAQHVREALAAGGTVIEPHPVPARANGPFLTSHGFVPVPAGGYVPAKGDVVVIQNYPHGDPNGHIAMYDGSHWVSDFRQRDIWAGPGYREARLAMQVYRP